MACNCGKRRSRLSETSVNQGTANAPSHAEAAARLAAESSPTPIETASARTEAASR